MLFMVLHSVAMKEGAPSQETRGIEVPYGICVSEVAVVSFVGRILCVLSSLYNLSL